MNRERTSGERVRERRPPAAERMPEALYIIALKVRETASALSRPGAPHPPARRGRPGPPATARRTGTPADPPIEEWQERTGTALWSSGIRSSWSEIIS